MRVLDELAIDFILETCHTAGSHAAYSNRAKIKVEDFQFAIRSSELLLGRVQQLLKEERRIDEAKKLFDKETEKEGAIKIGAGGEEVKRQKGKRGRKPKDAMVVET